MFDDFFHQIESELGPLNSDWFKELTARASENEGDNSAVVEVETSAHKDKDVFRAPVKTPGLDSQMCSTPRIFRRRWPRSPAPSFEDTPKLERQKLCPAALVAESSPCLFDLPKDCQRFKIDWGALKTTAFLDPHDAPTGLTTDVSSAQRICDSLGAQLNPELSWSSSFNTPSALTPTVILSKTENKSSPVSFLKDKEVIIVRKLFPSLSRDTEATSNVQHNDSSTEGKVQTAEKKSDSSPNHIEGVWRQTVPDAIKDGELRNTVESVLDGAEDVLSFFFTNSSSSLRRVKTRERQKRANGVIREVNSNHHLVADHTTESTSASKTGSSVAVTGLKSTLFSSQRNNKDFTQWTPLSLSDLQDSTNCVRDSETANKLASPHKDSSVKNDASENRIPQLGQSSPCTSEQQNVVSPDLPHKKPQGRISLLESSPALTFSRKPRKFVYQVQSSESKRMDNAADAVSGKHYQESSPCHTEDTNTGNWDRSVEPEAITVKHDLNPDHDLDMTQLCEAFAEDLTQDSNSFKAPPSRTDCLLTPTCTPVEVQPKTESATQRAGYVDHQAAETNRLTNVPSFESTDCDSGYPAVPSGFSPETLSCSDTKHLYSGFKTANNAVIVVRPEALMNAKAALDESLQPVIHTGTSSVTEPIQAPLASTAGEKLVSESCLHGHEAGKETSCENILRSEAAADNIPGTFTRQTNESGFETASNTRITISSVSLETAKDIFMESDEGQFDSRRSNNRVQVCSIKGAKPSKPSQHHSLNDDGSSSLTASQRADVTELCSMFEEAYSQYDFTQLKHAKMIVPKCPGSSQMEQEWDPDILSGIDFDDSFNCYLTERQVSIKHQSKTASVPNNLMNGDAEGSSINIRKPSEMPKKCNGFQEENSLAFCSGFKTAKGNAVPISAKCLSKARRIFADIEDTEGHVSLKSDCKADAIKRKENQSAVHVDTFCAVAEESELGIKPSLNTCNNFETKEAETQCAQMCSKANLKTLHRTLDQEPALIPGKMVNFGFSTAGGMKINMSENALQSARKLLNEGANDTQSRHDDSPAGANASSWTLLHNPSDVLADVSADLTMSDGSLPKAETEHAFENRHDGKQAASPRNGFKIASGKDVSVSASAIHESEGIFKEVNEETRSFDETKSKEVNAILDVEGDAVQSASMNGFKMASGKGVSVSEKAFMKAKTFFQNCEDISPVKGDATSVTDDCGFEAVVGNRPNSPGMSLKNKYVRRKCFRITSETLQPPSACGFSTASGAAVSVSAEALQSARAVLDDSTAALPGEGRLETSDGTSLSKNDALISGKASGFSTASGRKVVISEKALQKATTLFTDRDGGGLGSDPCDLSAAKTSAAGTEYISALHFNATSNRNVGAAKKQLNNSKDAFVSADDGSDKHRTYGSEALRTKHDGVPGNDGKSNKIYENVKNGAAKFDHTGEENVGFSTASGKGVCVPKSALKVAFEMFRDCDPQPVTNEQSTTAARAPPTNVDEKSKTNTASPSLPSQETRGNPSLLSRGSLNVDGCTVTQQKYLEQEALACAKALLEDDLNENRLLTCLDTDVGQKPTSRRESCTEVAVGTRKRPSDGERLKGQPPLKRTLAAEFDQVSDDRITCAPVKSSPTGTLKDRRVFKYNLKPNITYPSRNVVDQSSSNQDHLKLRTSDSKTPVFIPPFRKDLNAGTPKNGVPTAVAKASGVFVPPVKKKDASGNISVKDSALTSGGSAARTSSSCEIYHSDAEETKSEKKMEKHMTVPDIWKQSLELAQDMQNMRIRKKTRQRVRPLPGTLYLAKTAGVSRVSLKQAVGDKRPELHTEEQLYQNGVSVKVSQITSENAESFRFSSDDFFKRELFMETAGIQLADGGWLVPDSRGMMGKEEFYRALCDTPGVDPKLISEAWVHNHYRWVVWKRASMERAFPDVMGGRCFTPEQVLLQLKLRYDVEVDHSRRSALKKIMERDDTPAKTMVLCVCGIAQGNQSPVRSAEPMDTTDGKPESAAAVIWLTDGWYSIKALLDLPLSNMLRKGCLKVGVKLLIHGAELIGSQDACTPLEAPDSLVLKISSNSTRRARWDTKLGFHKDPRPFPLFLSSLHANGGAVSCVDIIVLRSYPTQWMERKPGSVFVFRNERAEHREAARYNGTKQKTLEHLFSKIQAQIEKEDEVKKKTRRSRTFSLQELKSMQEGEELHEAMESDPTFVEAYLSTQQVKAVSNYRRALTESKRAELHDRVHKALEEVDGGCTNRDVTPVWKLSIADSNDVHSACVYTLNVWRPSSELRALLKEGCRYKVYHLATSETKKRSGTSNIQFTANKKTQFQDIKVCPQWLSLHFPARQSVKFRDLQSPGFSSPCGEVDLVGYVISILDRQGMSPVLYLVDERFDFVSVRICSSLALLALEDLVKPLALLAVSNLQLRQHSGLPVPSLYAGEHALISTSPKEAYLREDLSRLKTFVEDYEHFSIVAEEKLSSLIPTGSLNSCESPRTPSVPKPNLRNNAIPHQTGRVFSPFTPVTKKTPIPIENSDTKNPRSVKRKRGLEYLSRLQNPSPLNPLGMVHTPRVSKTFNPPRRCETPRNPPTVATPPPENRQWVNDEEMAMINTQTLLKR